MVIGSVGCFLGVLYLGFGVDRTDFWSLSVGFTIAFGSYFLLITNKDKGDYLKWLVGLGLALRVALVFAFPLLSDDLYRFLWDGHLINAGINPFVELPAYYLEPGNEVPGLTQELFSRLNSPEYYTIYPPIAQAVFSVATWVAPGSWYGGAVVMKLFLLACEVGSLWLMWQLLPPQEADAGGGARVQGEGREQRSDYLRRENLLLYWLNPLIMVEILGNLHFEGAMVFFLLLAYYLLQGSKWGAAAVAFAASVASKLLPLMLLPFLIRRLWRWRTARPGAGWGWLRAGKPFLVFSLTFGVSCLLFFAPLLLSPDFITGFRSSLELYQRKFEFNASLYYLARAYGYYEVGWNKIATFGPLLARAAAIGILLLALFDRRVDWKSLPAGWLGAFVLYLLCATTVHPWYLSVPIVLCVFTRWRFPIVWSFLITLTYTNYLTVPYEENLWLVAVEYIVVSLVFLGEVIYSKKEQPALIK